MNKQQLIEQIQNILGEDTTKACAEKSLNAVLEAIKIGVKTKEEVRLIGFGTFSVVDRKARTCFNPQTREKIEVPASKAVKFKPGKDLTVE